MTILAQLSHGVMLIGVCGTLCGVLQLLALYLPD